MVMDAQPSPQSVGREFVRQYYTLLNKAPSFLHRFYTTQSSFIHDGVDVQNREPMLVIGQKNIHNKIQQLNFRDCHAKISQVDAQTTLGNGVVVQVTGELSNDGQPMRRFTQTFVLAAQSPKNYYVHNDIFRYQDCFEDENDVESRSENDDEQDNSESSKITETGNTAGGTPVPPNPVATVTTPAGIIAPNVVQGVAAVPGGIPTPQQQQMYYNMQQLQQQQTVSVPVPPTVTPTVAAAPLPQRQPQPINVTPTGAPIGQFNAQVNGLGHEPDQTPQQVLQQQPPTHLQQQQTPQLGQQVVVTPNIVTPVIQQAVSGLPIQQQPQHQQTPTGIIQHQPQQPHQQQPQQPSPPQSQPPKQQQQAVELDKLDSVSPVNSGVASAPLSDSEQNEPKYASSQNQEPTTYAHLLKAGPIGGGETPSPVPHNPHNLRMLGGGSGPTTQNYGPGQYGRGGDNGQQQGMPQRSNSIRNKDNNKNEYLERRPFNSYSRDRSERDENQLFIGNVPQNATDEEFREIFSKYGNVMDLKIKKNNLGPNNNNRPGPGYGFITFDNTESVSKCLSSGPIYYNSDGYEPVEINVEKKKRNDMNPRPHITNNGPMGDRSRQSGARSLSNSGGNGGGMMRQGNNNGGGNMMRGGSRSQGFNRGGMDNRGPPPNRGNSSSGGGGNNNYGRR
ncbi:G3BP2 family protein [Megaselia abdita]